MNSFLLALLICAKDIVGLINNRRPEADYVIPIAEGEAAMIHCISFFAETIFKHNGAEYPCQACKLKHAQYHCCIQVDLSVVPFQIRCTSKKDEWKPDDPNIPFIDVTVVSQFSGPFESQTETIGGRTVAYNNKVFYCNNKSNLTLLTAGSHIGLGWTSKDIADKSEGEELTTETPMATDRRPLNNINNFFDPQHKESQFSEYYANEEFLPLWTSEDIKLELMVHNTTFDCNGTSYVLPKGSQCMRPSARAIFVMVNCKVVERVFIVIAVIILLILAYIFLNLTLFLWDYLWHGAAYLESKQDRGHLI